VARPCWAICERPVHYINWPSSNIFFKQVIINSVLWVPNNNLPRWPGKAFQSPILEADTRSQILSFPVHCRPAIGWCFPSDVGWYIISKPRKTTRLFLGSHVEHQPSLGYVGSQLDRKWINLLEARISPRSVGLYGRRGSRSVWMFRYQANRGHVRWEVALSELSLVWISIQKKSCKNFQVSGRSWGNKHDPRSFRSIVVKFLRETEVPVTYELLERLSSYFTSSQAIAALRFPWIHPPFFQKCIDSGLPGSTEGLMELRMDSERKPFHELTKKERLDFPCF